MIITECRDNDSADGNKYFPKQMLRFKIRSLHLLELCDANMVQPAWHNTIAESDAIFHPHESSPLKARQPPDAETRDCSRVPQTRISSADVARPARMPDDPTICLSLDRVSCTGKVSIRSVTSDFFSTDFRCLFRASIGQNKGNSDGSPSCGFCSAEPRGKDVAAVPSKSFVLI
jgi:hypothetical protein